jgi:hypothetical protein
VPWNAGTSRGWTDKRGYHWVYITENGRRRARRENRIVMEGILGRRLEPWEDVHHINGNKSDNSPTNLQIIEHSSHTIISHANSRRTEQTKESQAVFARCREEINHLRRVNAGLLSICRDVVFALETAGRADVKPDSNYWATKLKAAITKAEGRV